jgi:predicted amidohydrolase
MRALLAAVRCEKGDVEGNLAAHRRLVDRAATEGCDLVLFPEMSLTGSVDPAVRPDRLISLDHPAVLALAGAARGGAAVCFGVAERSPSGQPYITQVVAAAGSITGVQRKRHLGQGTTVDEDFPGLAALVGPDGRVAARLPDWREGVLIVDVPDHQSD